MKIFNLCDVSEHSQIKELHCDADNSRSFPFAEAVFCFLCVSFIHLLRMRIEITELVCPTDVPEESA